MTTILKGNIVSAPVCGRLDVTEHGYLIAENGVITGVYPVLPEQYAGASVEDYGCCHLITKLGKQLVHYISTFRFSQDEQITSPINILL